MLRDKLQSSAYFDHWIEFIQTKAITPRKTSINSVAKAEGRAGRVTDLFDDAVSLVIMRYSRGDAVADMRDSIQQAAELLLLKHDTLKSIELEPNVRQMYERLDLNTLYSYFGLLAFAVSLRYPKDDLLCLLQLIGHAGEDALLDQVALALGEVDRSVAAESKFPKVYGSLVDVVRAPAAQRPSLLNKFVKSWYKLMKPIAWHDNHRGAEGAYFGYWCFEAALVAMLFEVDNTEFADYPNYPIDLVRDYRRSA